jgi:hypothetical protein
LLSEERADEIDGIIYVFFFTQFFLPFSVFFQAIIFKRKCEGKDCARMDGNDGGTMKDIAGGNPQKIMGKINS